MTKSGEPRLRRLFWRALCLAWVGGGSVGLLAQTGAPGATDPWVELRRKLTAAVSELKAPGAAWGIHVARLTNGAVLYGVNSSRLFIPASCTKLFTTAVALDRLGAGFRVVTPLSATTPPDAQGLVAGDLVWLGRGAPDLGGGEHPAGVLDGLVDAVVKAGIRRVEGSVIADESWFRTAPFGLGWNWDDLPEAYGAAVSALTFGDNVARVRVGPGEAGRPGVIRVEPWPEVFDLVNRTRTVGPDGSASLRYERLPGSRELWVRGNIPLGRPGEVERLAVPNPALSAARALQQALIARGIGFGRPARVRRSRDGVDGAAERSLESGQRVASTTSASLTSLVRDCLKPSQNLHAQLLLLQVGAEIEVRPAAGEAALIGETTDDTALAVEKRFLNSIGITADDCALEEGAGLSRKNLVTPAATVRLLRHMAAHPDAAIRAAWWNALPVGGVDGTLKSRFTRLPARGNVVAKTGSLRHVHSLAGYLKSASGEWFVFALFLNGFISPDAGASGRAELDRLVEILAAY